jgi:hypothetical protein
LFKLNAAWKLLGIRLERGLLDEASTAWIKTWCGNHLGSDLPLPVDSEFETELVWSAKVWQVAKVVNGDAEGSWQPVLMLLHLPALRSFWSRALRSQRFTWMTKALPKVWAVDTHTIRPGTVIAGLGITSWTDLPKLMLAGRAFDVFSTQGGKVQVVNAETWPTILAGAEQGPLLVRERFTLPIEGEMRASWQRNEAGCIVLKEA